MSERSDVGMSRPALSALGALALLLTSTALSPLFTSGRWVLPVIGTVAAIAAVGAALRIYRLPLAVVALTQLLVLAALLTVVFTDRGLLGLVPGPAAIDQLHVLLNGVGEQIATQKPPVAVTPEMMLLLVAALGAAAVGVDLLIAGVRTPAVAGLVLLCVVAIPASLSQQLLPWWSFALAVAAVLLLLVSNSPVRAAAAGPGATAAALRSPIMTVVLCASLAGALAVGSAVTGVGTAGRLPAGTGGGQGVALNPFTQLRGELGDRTATPLFTVTGMTQPTYLRAVTLDRFVNNQGWMVQDLAAGSSLGRAMGGQQLRGPVQSVTVRGEQYEDRWLPSPGIPTVVRGVGNSLGGYTYNTEAGVLQSAKPKPLPEYVVQAVNPGIGVEQLRAEGAASQSQSGIDPRWRELDNVDPAVAELARTLAGDARTTLDAAVALNAYFTNPANGFTYDLNTGGGTVGSDALVEFLTVTRRGFCEQYASAMAVMLRELGIASRVVLGFTPGTGDAALRTVTSDDAHAWVEVFFAGVGWVTFDPTPLTGGRGIVPAYVAAAGVPAPVRPDGQPTAGSVPTAAPTPAQPSDPTSPTPTVKDEQRQQSAGAPASTQPSGSVRMVVLLAVLAVLVLCILGAVPAGLRRWRRARRRTAGAPDAAWEELIDLSADRGVDVSSTETPRAAAARLAQLHRLDGEGQQVLADVITAVEHQWYASTAPGEMVVDVRRPTVLDQLVAAFARSSPLRLRQRILPRSVLHRRSR